MTRLTASQPAVQVCFEHGPTLGEGGGGGVTAGVETREDWGKDRRIPEGTEIMEKALIGMLQNSLFNKW